MVGGGGATLCLLLIIFTASCVALSGVYSERGQGIVNVCVTRIIWLPWLVCIGIRSSGVRLWMTLLFSLEKKQLKFELPAVFHSQRFDVAGVYSRGHIL